MKRILEILAFMPLMFLLNSCEGTEPDSNSAAGSQPGGEVELPQPPEQEKTSNVFVVDIFSTLEDDGDFFGIRSIDSAAQHISNQSGKKPLVYMFDRADFTVGKSHPFNKLSYNINIYQLFAQQEATTQTTTKGTAIATQYPISVYDGIAQGRAYMSGLTVSAPLSTATPVCIYTTKITSLDQIRQIYDARSKKLLENGVIVGVVDNSVKADVVKYVRETMSLRAVTYGSEDTKLDVLVVVPPSFVCRGIEAGKTVNLPFYKVRIEKWM